jgi:hypothetical protein
MRYKIIDIIILIILLSILIYRVVFFYPIINEQPYHEEFENINPIITSTYNVNINSIPSTTPAPTPIPMPTDTKTDCNADNNVIGYCLNYKGCCEENIIKNDCFCKHPFVQKCIKEFDECIINKDNNNCKDKLKECCIDYNKINIDNSNFNKPIKQEQQTKLICSISSTKNIDQKCMELCQTTPECKAYSVSAINCMLFNDIDPIQQKQGITPITDYYIKKSQI